MQIEVCLNWDNWEGWLGIGRCASLLVGMMYDELVWEKREGWLEQLRVYERVVGRVLGVVNDGGDGEAVEDARVWKGIIYSC